LAATGSHRQRKFAFSQTVRSRPSPPAMSRICLDDLEHPFIPHCLIVLENINPVQGFPKVLLVDHGYRMLVPRSNALLARDAQLPLQRACVFPEVSTSVCLIGHSNKNNRDVTVRARLGQSDALSNVCMQFVQTG
jgi:hypothetical protein